MKWEMWWIFQEFQILQLIIDTVIKCHNCVLQWNDKSRWWTFKPAVCLDGSYSQISWQNTHSWKSWKNTHAHKINFLFISRIGLAFDMQRQLHGQTLGSKACPVLYTITMSHIISYSLVMNELTPKLLRCNFSLSIWLTVEFFCSTRGNQHD